MDMTKSIKSGTRGFAPTRRQLISGSALAIGGLIIHSTAGAQPPNQVISHSEDSIHQEPVFAANRKRVYEALIELLIGSKDLLEVFFRLPAQLDSIHLLI